jgi:hypothetical protein
MQYVILKKHYLKHSMTHTTVRVNKLYLKVIT